MKIVSLGEKKDMPSEEIILELITANDANDKITPFVPCLPTMKPSAQPTRHVTRIVTASDNSTHAEHIGCVTKSMLAGYDTI